MDQPTIPTGYVLLWTYYLPEYQDQMERFKRGKRKRPPQPHQMWVPTIEKAEAIKAEFLAAHREGGIKIEASPPPKKQSIMALGAKATHTRTEIFG